MLGQGTTYAGTSLAAKHLLQGLRLHDNPALLEAIKAEKLFPVFCLDPWFVESKRVGSNRMKFLLESLEDLSESLSKRKSGLLVSHHVPWCIARCDIGMHVSIPACLRLGFNRQHDKYDVLGNQLQVYALPRVPCIHECCLDHICKLTTSTGKQTRVNQC